MRKKADGTGIGRSKNRASTLEKLWAKEYHKNGGNGTKAVRSVWGENVFGYHTAAMKAMRMKKKPAIINYLRQLDDMLMEQAGPSIERLAILRDNSEDERVQLGASKTLLDSYQLMIKRQEKNDKRKVVSENILLTNLSDEQLLRKMEDLKGDMYDIPQLREEEVEGRPTESVPGVGEEKVQDRPDPLDGELSGVPRRSRSAQRSEGRAEDSGGRVEEGVISSSTRAPEVNDDNDFICNAADTPQPEHTDTDNERTFRQLKGIPERD